jgi:hypothetical protein
VVRLGVVFVGLGNTMVTFFWLGYASTRWVRVDYGNICNYIDCVMIILCDPTQTSKNIDSSLVSRACSN